jgi:hypothetical protein
MDSDDFPSRVSWHRVARAGPAGASKDITGLIGQELRHVFSFAKTSPDIEGLRRLLEDTEKKHENRNRN